jgi:glycosyltransferase involved in cell wall biosynthesis
MAPLGAAVGERLGTRWATLDLDEDDAGFARSHGDLEAAAGYDRLLEVFGPSFGGFAAASAGEAARIGQRHGLAIEELPNAVQVPPAPRRAAGEPASLLFVGNLTYPPNLEAAALLVERILPALEGRLERPLRVTLVGPHDGSLDRLRRAEVEVTGFVADLEPYYASAAVAVVPLQSGAGTRIKLLEAFAHRVPVVASPAAAEGLQVVDGRHVLLADDPESAARAIGAVLTREGLADTLSREASRLVRERYSYEAVVPAIRAFFSRAAERT